MGQDFDNSPISKLAALIADRKTALSRDNGWADYADDECSAAAMRLAAIQDDLLTLDFGDRESHLHGLSLLLSGTDAPNFADDFKNRLFEILRGALTASASEDS